MARRPNRSGSQSSAARIERSPDVLASRLHTYRQASASRLVQSLLPGRSPLKPRVTPGVPGAALRKAPTRPTLLNGLVPSGPIGSVQSVQGDSPRRVTKRGALPVQSVQGDSPRRVRQRAAAVTQSAAVDRPTRGKEAVASEPARDRDQRDRCKARPEPRRAGGGTKKRFSPWCK